jgi:large subunit ribosomal protein L25
MSEVASLQVVQREERGKGPCARLRSNGLVPGVFYNSKGENISFAVDNTALGKAFEKVRYSKMLELQVEIDGKVEKRNVLFKKLVSHPVKRRYEHVDFIGIDLDKEVQSQSPSKLRAEPKVSSLVENWKLSRSVYWSVLTDSYSDRLLLILPIGNQ